VFKINDTGRTDIWQPVGWFVEIERLTAENDDYRAENQRLMEGLAENVQSADRAKAVLAENGRLMEIIYEIQTCPDIIEHIKKNGMWEQPVPPAAPQPSNPFTGETQKSMDCTIDHLNEVVKLLVAMLQKCLPANMMLDWGNGTPILIVTDSAAPNVLLTKTFVDMKAALEKAAPNIPGESYGVRIKTQGMLPPGQRVPSRPEGNGKVGSPLLLRADWDLIEPLVHDDGDIKIVQALDRLHFYFGHPKPKAKPQDDKSRIIVEMKKE
jgi:hypothetical protein